MDDGNKNARNENGSDEGIEVPAIISCTNQGRDSRDEDNAPAPMNVSL